MELSVADLVGLPFREGGRDPATGLDCYGLVRVVLGLLGVELPLLAETYWTGKADDRAIAATTARELGAWLPVERPRPGDVVLLTVLGRPVHVGVVLDAGDFVHAYKPAGAVVVDRLGGLWRHRVAGFYAHPSLASRR